jgi:hypothetical protein
MQAALLMGTPEKTFTPVSAAPELTPKSASRADVEATWTSRIASRMTAGDP